MEFKKEKDNDEIRLKYWNGRGLMEVPRMILAISGKKKNVDFWDDRYSTDNLEGDILPYNEICNELAHNLGRLPLLMIKRNSDENNVETIGQSGAINYYLAKKFNLLGDNLLEETRILELIEHLNEMKSIFYKLCPYGIEPKDEDLLKWFKGGVDDQSPHPADGRGRKSRYLRWWSGRIEYLIGEKFAVGDRISLVDLIIYNTFRETLREEEQEGVPEYRREPFYNKKMMDELLEIRPKLKSICDNVGENGLIKEYLATRGIQKF